MRPPSPLPPPTPTPTLRRKTSPTSRPDSPQPSPLPVRPDTPPPPSSSRRRQQHQFNMLGEPQGELFYHTPPNPHNNRRRLRPPHTMGSPSASPPRSQPRMGHTTSVTSTAIPTNTSPMPPFEDVSADESVSAAQLRPYGTDGSDSSASSLQGCLPRRTSRVASLPSLSRLSRRRTLSGRTWLDDRDDIDDPRLPPRVHPLAQTRTRSRTRTRTRIRTRPGAYIGLYERCANREFCSDMSRCARGHTPAERAFHAAPDAVFVIAKQARCPGGAVCDQSMRQNGVCIWVHEGERPFCAACLGRHEAPPCLAERREPAEPSVVCALMDDGCIVHAARV